MSDFKKEDGTSRAELVQRVELMEAMIAEGRQFTMRRGWIFVLWGLVDFAGEGWQYFLPDSHFAGRWAWPVCLAAGAVLTLAGLSLQKRKNSYGESTRWRSLEAVWAMMGVTMAVYIASAMATNFSGQYSYVAALLMMMGMAHAISAVILRWRVQGAVAAIWWAGGAAIFFFHSSRATNVIFLLEMCFGMIAFGLYVMMLERRKEAVQKHA